MKRKAKKLLLVIIIMILSINIVNCNHVSQKNENELNKTGSNVETSKSTNNVNDSTEMNSAKSTNLSEKVDFDLTTMSQTFCYATVDDMMRNPARYLGKTVKMKGQYYATYDESNNTYYTFCLISDALGCCSSGMEFVWGDGSHIYPKEYPEDKAEVTVCGTYAVYEENGEKYCRIENATLTLN